jgi:transposase InsO family protein
MDKYLIISYSQVSPLGHPRVFEQPNGWVPKPQHYTDLHDEGEQKIMAIIDDCSRFCLTAVPIPNKESNTTATVLLETMKNYCLIPYCVWSDNGGEFRGDFQYVLEKSGIKHAFTDPYTPQQNGKVERFWQTFTKSSMNSINEIVRIYSDTHHTSLERMLFSGYRRLSASLFDGF